MNIENKTGQVLTGVVGLRNPQNRYEIIKTIPIYEASTPELITQEDQVLYDIGKVFAEMFKHYIEAEGGAKY